MSNLAATSHDDMALVDLIVVGIPDRQVDTRGLDRLRGLAETGTIAILGVEFVAADAEGTVSRVPAEQLDARADVDLGFWGGERCNLLDEDDLLLIESDLRPGSLAMVVVYENLRVLGLVDAWRARGSRLMAHGDIPAVELESVLDVSELLARADLER